MASTTKEVSDEAKLSNTLGLFAKLPVEIRLLIWDSLFLQIPSRTYRTHKPAESPTNRLSILRCSRDLYNEISHQLYKTLTQFLRISSRHHSDYWITAGVSSDKMYVEWHLKDDEAVRAHLSDFPCAKLHEARIQVELRRPSSRDPGQTVHLWQQISIFVDIIQDLRHPPRVRVRFVGHWCKYGKPQQNIQYPKGYRPDHDIAILPFTHLPKSQWDYFISDGLDIAISSEPRGSPHSILYRMKNGENLGTAEVDSLSLDTRIFLDTMLDNIPGKTAGILRLKRFQHWYHGGDKWTVPYEKRLMADLANNLPVVMKHDPGLQLAQQRYGALILRHYMAQESRLSADHSRQSSWPDVQDELIEHHKWDPEFYSEEWPEGLIEFHLGLALWFRKSDRPVFAEYLRKNSKVKDFLHGLRWWAYEARTFLYEPISEREWCGLGHYLERPCDWCKKYDLKKGCLLCREGFSLRLLRRLPQGGCYDPEFIMGGC